MPPPTREKASLLSLSCQSDTAGLKRLNLWRRKSLMGSWFLAGMLVYPVLSREAVGGLSDSGARERAGDPRRGLRPAGHRGERGDGPAGGGAGAGAHQRRRPADPPAADATDHVGDAGPLPLRPECLLSVAHVRTGPGLRGARLLAGGVRGPGRGLVEV